MKKELLKQMEVFDLIGSNKLTPNQYYILCCIRDSVTPLQMNLHLELRQLNNAGWLKEKDSGYQVEPHGIKLINQIEKFFVVQKKKTSLQIMGKAYSEKIKQWREIFPNKLGGHGKPLRGSPKNIENNFRWFFENHDYDWDVVMKATDFYIRQQEVKDSNHKYTRQAHYFIRKSDGVVQSDLANYCELVLSGGDQETPKFKTKVV